ncbi:hypothetical protein CN224_32115 [Sinorhizobium meliloti]|nr:hypothetical protein CN224_32115 [Sinorhizobium meliloti]
MVHTPSAPLRHIGYLAVTVSGKIWNGGIRAGFRGTVRNSVRWAMMMKRRESSHGYRERTSGPAPGWT